MSAPLNSRGSGHISSVMKRVTKRVYLRKLSNALRPKNCIDCGKKLPRQRNKNPLKGRPREFCSATCRQRAYEKRKYGGNPALRLLQQDLATARLREIVRQEVRRTLAELGMITPETETPTPRPPLHIVADEDGGDE